MRRFAFRLAVKLGIPNVDAMLRGLTARQFQEWQAYFRLEPFDETRADYRAAQIVQMLAAIHTRKGKTPPSIAELVLKWEADPPKAKQDWRQMKEITRLIAEAYKDTK
jgi:hypothetical protein